jgi:hypothetical protein
VIFKTPLKLRLHLRGCYLNKQEKEAPKSEVSLGTIFVSDPSSVLTVLAPLSTHGNKYQTARNLLAQNIEQTMTKLAHSPLARITIKY